MSAWQSWPPSCCSLAQADCDEQPLAEIIDTFRVDAFRLGTFRGGRDAEQEASGDQDAVRVNLQRAEAEENRMHLSRESMYSSLQENHAAMRRYAFALRIMLGSGHCRSSGGRWIFLPRQILKSGSPPSSRRVASCNSFDGLILITKFSSKKINALSNARFPQMNKSDQCPPSQCKGRASSQSFSTPTYGVFHPAISRHIR